MTMANYTVPTVTNAVSSTESLVENDRRSKISTSSTAIIAR